MECPMKCSTEHIECSTECPMECSMECSMEGSMERTIDSRQSPVDLKVARVRNLGPVFLQPIRASVHAHMRARARVRA